MSQGSFEEFFIIGGGDERITTPAPLSARNPAINFTLEDPIDDAVSAAWTRESNIVVSYHLANATTKASRAEHHKPNLWLGLMLFLGLIFVN
jgi:hypothetical protein